MIDEVDAVRTLQRVPRWTYTLPLPKTSSALVKTGGTPTAVVEQALSHDWPSAWQDDRPCCYDWSTWE
jgi:hypothetical protein